MVGEPRFSVVIPCYKGERFLGEAIESCLRQTMGDFEVIVVDDGSPDNCAKIAERYVEKDERVRLIRRGANGGVSEAFNTGFNAARGRYFTRLAQDDMFADTALATMTDFLDARPEIGLTYCNCIGVDEEGRFLDRASYPDDPERALLMGNRIGICVAWRREVWQRVGGFNREFDAAEDYEYWLRVWKHFQIAKCDGPAMLYARNHWGMGSRVFAERQERSTIRLLRQAYPKHIPRWRAFLMKRRAISRAIFSTAMEYRHHGQVWLALRCLMRSVMAWPVSCRRDELDPMFGRLKFTLLLLSGSTRGRPGGNGRGDAIAGAAARSTPAGA